MTKTSLALQKDTKIKFDLLKAVKQVSADALLLELIESYKKNNEIDWSKLK